MIGNKIQKKTVEFDWDQFELDMLIYMAMRLYHLSYEDAMKKVRAEFKESRLDLTKESACV